jgi:hypothetical protein
MSAAIVRLAHRTENARNGINPPFLDHDLDLIGYNYGDPIPDLSGYEKVILVDISFPPDRMVELFQNFGLNLIWLDHHISAIRSVDEALHALQGGSILIPGIRDLQHAACELTWHYFFPSVSIPEIVRLLGRYDCFGHRGTPEEKYVLEFQYGAREVIHNVETAFRYLTNHITGEEQGKPAYGGSIEEIHAQGATVYAYLCEEAKQVYKNGFEVELGYRFPNPYPTSVTMEEHIPIKFICINRDRFNPTNFGIDYHKDGYDGCACFYFDGKGYNFSLYNDNGLVDVSQIAHQYGGGGHKGAAGFRVDSLDSIVKR